MQPAEIIESAFRKSRQVEFAQLSSLERQIVLLGHAGTLSDMGGVDLFLDRYSAWLPEAVGAFQAVGASEVAQCLTAIQIALPAHPDHLLDRATDLLCARVGYDHDAVLRFVASQPNSNCEDSGG